MIEEVQHNMLYSCVTKQQQAHEQFASDHALSYVISGEVHFHANDGSHISKQGTIGLFRRNQLVKATKIPDSDGKSCKSLSIFLFQDVLRQFSSENDIHAGKRYTGPLMVDLSRDGFIRGYFDSLLPYMKQPGQMTNALAILKTKEAIELLLRSNDIMKDFLFDFSEPHKIDLEAFMNKNFHFNVRLEKFAKLTGRSLATFKRDFKTIYDLSPEKWLLQKRLEEAHYLIKQKNQNPSSVYLDVGFENLSHFSHSFKKLYGYNASSL